jgi:hypothetical protein
MAAAAKSPHQKTKKKKKNTQQQQQQPALANHCEYQHCPPTTSPHLHNLGKKPSTAFSSFSYLTQKKKNQKKNRRRRRRRRNYQFSIDGTSLQSSALKVRLI